MSAPAQSALRISHFTATSCLGGGVEATWSALAQQRGGLAPCAFETVDLNTWLGEAAIDYAQPVRADLAAYDCRNNRLAQRGLEQDDFARAIHAAAARYGRDRIGVFIGTSTSGILQTELAYRRRQRDADGTLVGALPADFNNRTTHNFYSVTDFTRRYFELTGVAASVSTACSSSAKVFAMAQRMMHAGIIDAALVGGVDSLCLTTLYGFNSLELLSPQACRPYDAARNGISIGEAAAFALLERAPENQADANAVFLLGSGESSDAHHMSSPHPEGLGAQYAMRDALANAGIAAADIDYINLHGTATQTNDAAEGKAVRALFGAQTPCSSTKGATGHTLAAAGALEAVIALLALQRGMIPAGINTQTRDPATEVNYILQNRAQPLRYVLSNSFGFGGSNCSLVFGRAS